jgi:hypothetical protein
LDGCYEARSSRALEGDVGGEATEDSGEEGLGSSIESFRMKLTLEPREGFLLATAAGRASLNEAFELGKSVCDAAAERGICKILFDCYALEAELSITERYILAMKMTEYCQSRSTAPCIAVIGKEPTITGVGAQLARKRGAIV